MTREKLHFGVIAGLGLIAACCVADLAWAQQIRQFGRRVQIQGDGQNESDFVDGVFLPPDRTAKRRLELAKELLDEKRYGESVRYLGSLLEGAEDYFFKPDPTQGVYRSLKAEAGRLIGDMPTEGKSSYELQFGAKARRMLSDATAAHDVSGLMEVARRFFYTQAGCEATMLLGRHHLDHARPLAAALCFQRLLDTPGVSERFEPMLSLSLATCWMRAGMSDRAQQTLSNLKKNHPGPVLVAGKSVPLFVGDNQAIAWLTDKIGTQQEIRIADSGQWTLFRGDAARNAPSSGGVPLLSPRWRVRTATHPAVEKLVSQLRQAYTSQDIVALPSLHPLAVGSVVLMRTSRGLLAVDFATGKRIWEAKPASDTSLEQLVMASRAQQQATQTTPALVAGLDQRMWDDATYGTMSSDGQQVFVIEDLELAGGTNQPTIVMFNGQRRGGMYGRDSDRSNRLAAFDLRTEGKLTWSIGGSTGEDEPKLAGASFLGPPLPLVDRLYALAEMKAQEIRLVVLSAKTGEMEWSQQLAVVEQNNYVDQFRRAAGAAPSFADGVLVCPTSAGAIVAIDLTTRSLLWGYEYPRANQQFDRLQMLRMNVGTFPGATRQANDRWVDASVTIADGRVLATPVETDHLYCLSLLDGKLLWKQERGNNVYVACVHKGKVIVVGHRHVTAFKLSDGQPAWERAIELPSGAVPSGRGFYSGDHYYLPLTSAEVAKINLSTATIESRARSRHGDVPGNLICLGGEVISQNVDYLETYYQLDALKAEVTKTLKDSPDDARALARLGEIELNEGQLTKAIGRFRRSYEIDADEATRDLLVDSLLEGLKVDFAANRNMALELEKLIDQEQQRAKYLRLVAVGLQKAGETLPAFEAFTRLADAKVDSAAPDEPNLEKLDEAVSVRRDRWVQAQLTQLRAAARPEERETIDTLVAARLQAAIDLAKSEGAQSTKALRQFLNIFGTHPAADEAREKLSLLLKGSDHLLEKELLLGQLRTSSSPERARAATARLAMLLVDARQNESAAVIYRELVEKWAGEVCLDGKTGQQLLDELPADGPVRKLLAGNKPWPTGDVKASDGQSKLSNSRYQRAYGLATRGNTEPFFTEMSVNLDQQQQAISGQDGLGIERFRVALNEQGVRRNAVFHGFNNPMLNYTSVNHHLMLLCMGHQLLAIDALRGKEMVSNRVLWAQDLTEQVPGVPANQGIHPRQVNIGWGSSRFMAADAYGRPIGTMGPVNYSGICFQRFRELVCVHPLTGEVQWTRKNATLGSDIFGDGEILLVAPPDATETLVLRALDGELLGKCRVAPVEQRMTTLGRLVLAWKPESGRPVVVLQDPWASQDKWSFKFDSGAKAAVVGDEAVGVLEPSGQFTIISLPDGKTLVKEKLPLELTRSALLGIYILRSRDQYTLVTNATPTSSQANVNIQPAPGGLDNPLVNGQMFAFDRHSGKALWPAPVKIEQQGLLLAQPCELPIVTFARHKHTATQAGQHETKTSLMCVDKRSGRVVYKNDSLQMVINNFELQGDRAESQVSLMFPGKTINLKFTDDPVPAPPANEAATEKKQASTGLIQAFGNLIKNLGDVAPDANDKPRKPGTDDD